MPNPVVHFEIMGKDAPRLQQFYRDLFDWKVDSVPEMGGYGVVEAQDGKGIGGGVGSNEHESYVTFYVEVADPQAYLDKAKSMGGKEIMPVSEMGGLVFAMFDDPEGNHIGIVKAGMH